MTVIVLKYTGIFNAIPIVYRFIGIIHVHYEWVTLCKHVTCTSPYVYDANALITFVEPNNPRIVGLSVGLVLGVLAVVITVAIVLLACKKNG